MTARATLRKTAWSSTVSTSTSRTTLVWPFPSRAVSAIATCGDSHPGSGPAMGLAGVPACGTHPAGRVRTPPPPEALALRARTRLGQEDQGRLHPLADVVRMREAQLHEDRVDVLLDRAL